MDFVTELGADVVIDYHEQYIRDPGTCHHRHCLRQPGSPGVRVTVEGRRSSPRRTVQIVASAVRISAALTLSESSLFSPKVCVLRKHAQRQGTTAFSGLMHLDLLHVPRP